MYGVRHRVDDGEPECEADPEGAEGVGERHEEPPLDPGVVGAAVVGVAAGDGRGAHREQKGLCGRGKNICTFFDGSCMLRLCHIVHRKRGRRDRSWFASAESDIKKSFFACICLNVANSFVKRRFQSKSTVYCNIAIFIW